MALSTCSRSNCAFDDRKRVLRLYCTGGADMYWRAHSNRPLGVDPSLPYNECYPVVARSLRVCVDSVTNLQVVHQWRGVAWNSVQSRAVGHLQSSVGISRKAMPCTPHNPAVVAQLARDSLAPRPTSPAKIMLTSSMQRTTH